MILPLVVNLRDSVNGNTKAMNANGATINKSYSYSPSAGEVALVQSVAIILDSTGSNNGFTRFGSIAALANGLELSVTISGVTTVLMNIKDNADFCTYLSQNNFGSPAQSTLGLPIGFGGSTAVFCGSLDFKANNLILNGDNGDSVQFKVKDNISGVAVLVSSIELLLQS